MKNEDKNTSNGKNDVIPFNNNTGINDMSRIGRVEVSALLGDAREVIFVHNGEEYRLRLTANNKLILTK